MINVYQYPTEKNPTVGMTFEFFKTMSLGVHAMKYSDLTTAIENIGIAKVRLLAANTEALWHYCDDIANKNDHSIVESIKTLRESVIYALENQDKYEDILLNIKEKANFMRTLIKAMPENGGHREAVVMMSATIQKFCREELDERKKNKSEE